jgi:pimeloyl-ACP methyl ester carboxylesterase
VLPFPKLSVAGREIAAFARQAWLLRHDINSSLPAAVGEADDVVVCLHGLFATAGVLRPLRARLERYPGVQTASFTYPVGPGVKTLARRLHELLCELPERSRVHLLGHSVGGVVARYFAQEMGDPRVVQTISLGAPFAGVAGVGWLGVEVARDLSPTSTLLRQLRLSSRRRVGVRHLSLVAENDAVVGAPLSHALPGGDVVMIRGCGHNTMLFCDRTAEHVERRIVDEVERCRAAS